MFYTFSSPSQHSSSSFQLACMCDEMRLDIHNVESRQIQKLILKKPFGSSKNPVWWVLIQRAWHKEILKDLFF